MITRRQFNWLAAGVGAGLVAAGAGTAWASPKRYQPIRKGDGHYTQPWFLDSFRQIQELPLLIRDRNEPVDLRRER